jgi:hypothetical protein
MSVLGLAPLTIDGVNTTDSKGIVAQSLLLARLKVTIPMWDPIPEPGVPAHRLQLYWISNGIVKLLDTLDVTPAPPPIRDYYDLYISLGDLLSAPFRVAQLYYTVTTDGGLNMNSMAGTATITIDRDPPRWKLPRDTLRFVVPPVPALNEQYLLANPLVRFSLPVYNIGAAGDSVELFVSNLEDPPSGLLAAGRSMVDFSTTPWWTVALDAEAFRSLNNGPAYVFCKIFDATGNYSARSVGLPFVVSFATTPLPVLTLRAPEVKHSLKNGYLHCNSKPSFMLGVNWWIPADSNIWVNDSIVIVWQGFNENNWATKNLNVTHSQTITWTSAHTTTGAIITVGSFETTLFPLRAYKSASLIYEVWRNGKRVAVSEPGDVRVDLTYSTGWYCTPQGNVSGS